MIELSIPGRGDIRLAYLTLDLNGTIAFDGRLIDGVTERLQALQERVELHLLTADTYGALPAIEGQLGFSVHRIQSSADKAQVVEDLGSALVVAIGNGANDARMLNAAALGIAVLGPEGLAHGAVQEADVITPDILAALDLLLHPQRLVATLRL